jgi:hypothetical protein
MDSAATDIEDLIAKRAFRFPSRHFLSAAALNRPDAEALLDLADAFVGLNRRHEKKIATLRTCWRRRSAAAWSTPGTGGTSIRRKPCWTP